MNLRGVVGWGDGEGEGEARVKARAMARARRGERERAKRTVCVVVLLSASFRPGSSRPGDGGQDVRSVRACEGRVEGEEGRRSAPSIRGNLYQARW